MRNNGPGRWQPSAGNHLTARSFSVRLGCCAVHVDGIMMALRNQNPELDSFNRLVQLNLVGRL
jgi:hypothetical protein